MIDGNYYKVKRSLNVSQKLMGARNYLNLDSKKGFTQLKQRFV